MNNIKYQTMEEITHTNKYKYLLDAYANDNDKQNNFSLFKLFLFYFDELQYCQEYLDRLNKHMDEYFSNFVDVKDIGIGDKNIYEVIK